MDYSRGKRFLDTLPDWERGRPPQGPLEHYLPRVRAMLRRCGDPQQRFGSVIVAGTNGKGTVASLLAALLQASGRRTGLYTSPHLHSQRERIQVDGGILDKDSWADGIAFVHDVTRGFEGEGLGPFSRFEALTVLAAHLFASEGVEVAVFEVGLGGRHDATNAWDHDAAILTPVALDHCAVLGRDLLSIAGEKLPVARPGRPLFTTASQDPGVLDLVRRRAREKGIPLILCGPEGLRFQGQGETVPYLAAPEPAAARPSTWVENARLAVAAASRICPDLDAGRARKVLDSHEWPGRFEQAREDPQVLLDGAHNPAAAEALAADLGRAGSDWIFVVGVNEDHQAERILSALRPAAGRFLLTESGHAKAMSAGDLAACSTGAAAGVATEVESCCRKAFERALAVAGEGGRVCVTGSLHLAARAREHFGLPFQAEGIGEEVARESLECLALACERLGLRPRRVSEDGNVMRLRGGRRPLLFLRNKHPFNDYAAARLAEDKGYQHELLAAAGLPVPRTMQLFNPFADDRFNRYKRHRTVEEMAAAVDAEMAWPVLVKKARGSISQGVYLETGAEGVARRLQSLFENAGLLDNLVLVQSYVSGEEFRAVATQGELLLAYAKAGGEPGLEDLNPLHHHSGRAERVTDEEVLAPLRALAGEVAGVVDLGFYAIDLIRDARGAWWVLELNPNPFCYFYNRSNGRGDFVGIYERLLRKYVL